MGDYPKFVEFHEEGPREGFQMERKFYSVEEKASLINALSETGLKQIQVGSLVNAKKVPAMGDVPELFAIIKKKPGVDYTALWLNERGFARARALPGISLQGYLYFYASDALARSNNDRSADQMRREQLGFVKMYEAAGVPIKAASIMTSFGCNMEGEISPSKVTDLLPWIREITVGRGHPMPAISLADTMGWATPESMRRLIGSVREIEPNVRIGTHIHDTRGLGIANLFAALEMGVSLFDSSIAGLGGCPFATHGNNRTAGNVCTEDAVFMCQELGIETGVDLEKLIAAARLAERLIGEPLAGKVMHSGSLRRYRH